MGVLCGGSEGAARLPGCLGQSCSVSSPAPLNIPVIHLIQFHRFTQIASPLKKNDSNCAWVAPGVRTKPSANSLLTRPDRGGGSSPAREKGKKKLHPFQKCGWNQSAMLWADEDEMWGYGGRRLHLPRPNAPPHRLQATTDWKSVSGKETWEGGKVLGTKVGKKSYKDTFRRAGQDRRTGGQETSARQKTGKSHSRGINQE